MYVTYNGPMKDFLFIKRENSFPMCSQRTIGMPLQTFTMTGAFIKKILYLLLYSYLSSSRIDILLISI